MDPALCRVYVFVRDRATPLAQDVPGLWGIERRGKPDAVLLVMHPTTFQHPLTD
jgi:hypothetical protein